MNWTWCDADEWAGAVLQDGVLVPRVFAVAFDGERPVAIRQYLLDADGHYVISADGREAIKHTIIAPNITAHLRRRADGLCDCSMCERARAAKL